MELNAATRQALESKAIAHLVTINPDGSPQVSCVWVGLDGEEVVLASMGAREKRANLERDPRVVLSVEQPVVNEHGLQEYLVVRGRARITEGGAPELLQHLAHTYLGPDVKFPPMENPPPGYIVHISVERVSGIGPWTD